MCPAWGFSYDTLGSSAGFGVWTSMGVWFPSGTLGSDGSCWVGGLAIESKMLAKVSSRCAWSVVSFPRSLVGSSLVTALIAFVRSLAATVTSCVGVRVGLRKLCGRNCKVSTVDSLPVAAVMA